MLVFNPGDMLPSSGLQGNLHLLCIYTHTTMHTNKNKSLREKTQLYHIRYFTSSKKLCLKNKMSMCTYTHTLMHIHSHEQEYTHMYKHTHNTEHPEK